MTRINVVDPALLTDQHLIAEAAKELPRVLTLALRWDAAGRPGSIPEAYTLGKGHVRFLYPRLPWVAARHRALHAECASRGYQLTHPPIEAPAGWGGADWAPDDAALAVNLARLHERLQARLGWYTLRGVPVSPTHYLAE